MRIQVAVALIIYLVLRLLHKTSNSRKSFTTFCRAFGHCLFKTIILQRHVERLENVVRRHVSHDNQLAFAL